MRHNNTILVADIRMEVAVTPTGNDSTCQAIELALSVLESSPKEDLPQYLDRLQKLTNIA